MRKAEAILKSDTKCFGPGWGPFGRHRNGPFGRLRGGRMFDSGALRLVVLGLIAEAPRHGYEIIKALRTRFQGAYAPSPGAIYPMLAMLEEAGLVASQARGLKRLFSITPAGHAWLKEQQPELDRIKAQLTEAAAPIVESGIGDAVHAFRVTLFDKMRNGALDAQQAEKLKEILGKAQKAIEDL